MLRPDAECMLGQLIFDVHCPSGSERNLSAAHIGHKYDSIEGLEDTVRAIDTQAAAYRSSRQIVIQKVRSEQ
ncbi:hypothetical protein L226DRAFT_534200 [Lentinus tigrinus ALCF2SS1-7]|uniref:Uncharacterized protein n=1 Tax=Lentinus tigrinus ALCF2SS1-6 TaxID=1328759 RepID=A0A5C2SJI3_9APHY|nr:hypothetical protein L227DRAFT_54796 [Lentinus tigrinus ALCF2SS1-6]RPD76153.1 hypothetical protein L226DRAFT_534200 [Lentinus tigrinus ALCF2SS1-7]